MTLAEKIQSQVDKYTAQKLDLEAKLANVEKRLLGLLALSNRVKFIPPDEQETIIELLS